MKTKHHIEVMHVISEPGDLTHYDYAYHQDGYMFYFMPIDNHFKYPQQIDYFKIKNVDTKDLKKADDTVMEISKRFDCNPCTVMECIRTMQEAVI